MPVPDIADALPPIEVLRERCRSLAVLEQIIGGRYPCYAYTTAWGSGEAATMDNGSGDEWAVVFTAAGAFIRVFDHESPMSPYRDADHELWPGLLDGLPAEFRPQIEEPAFAAETGEFLATAVLWRRTTDDRRHTGRAVDAPPDDGSFRLEILLDDVASRFLTFADAYYEISLDRSATEHVIAHRPLTDTIIRTLKPAADLATVRTQAAAIGYPVAEA